MTSLLGWLWKILFSYGKLMNVDDIMAQIAVRRQGRSDGGSHPPLSRTY